MTLYNIMDYCCYHCSKRFKYNFEFISLHQIVQVLISRTNTINVWPHNTVMIWNTRRAAFDQNDWFLFFLCQTIVAIILLDIFNLAVGPSHGAWWSMKNQVTRSQIKLTDILISNNSLYNVRLSNIFRRMNNLITLSLKI